MVKIEFKTDGAAFRNEYTGEEDAYAEKVEIKRILLKICKAIDNGHTEGSVMDYNGNKVGTWSI